MLSANAGVLGDRLDEWRCLLTLGPVARPDIDAEDDLGGLLLEDVQPVSVEASGGGLAAVAHLGVGARHNAIPGDSPGGMRGWPVPGSISTSWATRAARSCAASLGSSRSLTASSSLLAA